MTIPRTIHFIWLGNPQPRYESQALLGPNAIANHLYQDNLWQIKYWFDASHEDYFENQLNPRILRQPIDDFDIPGKREGIRSRSHNGLRRSVIETMRDLHRYQAYSAMKDLFELYILYFQGGFYFDTTTFVPDPTLFFQALAAESDRTLPQFVLNRPEVGYKHFKKIGGFEEFIGAEGFRFPEDKNRVVAVDFWAVAANKQDAFMKKSANRYVQRWKYISKAANSIKIFQQNGKLRRFAVANLIDWSVKDTFIQMYGEDVAQMNDRCFQAFSVDRFNSIFYTLKQRTDRHGKSYYEKKPKDWKRIGFQSHYEADYALYWKLFEDQNIRDLPAYIKLLRRIDAGLKVTRQAQFNAASWVDKYQFFKHSGQTWVN
jgi:hypothetical protein